MESLNYRVQGQGEPLVMIMGLTAKMDAWKYQTRELQKNFQVVTFDNRGVGKSDKPAGPYTTKMMAEDTVALMDYLGINQANVLGVSLGGAVAQELAIKHPERVKRLILASTYAYIDKENGGTSEMMETANWPVRRGIRRLISLAVNGLAAKAFYVPLTWVESLFLSEADTRGFLGQRDAALGHNTRDRLGLIQTPTLVITGTEDRVIKASSSDTLANLLPSARLVRLNEGSHLACVEMRAQFNREVLSFLQRGQGSCDQAAFC